MKLKIDVHSIKFKMWLYFIVFAAILMMAIWIAQVFMLNHFYATMKSSQTQTVAKDIKFSFKHNSNDTFLKEVGIISNSYDMYIFVVSYDGRITYFTPNSDGYEDSSFDSGQDTFYSGKSAQYEYQIRKLNEEMIKSGGTAQIVFNGDEDSRKILAYGNILHSNKKADMIVYIFSPLWPVSATIEILKSQLIIVTTLALIFACLFSFYLSFRITRPISKMEGTAKRLAAGEYGIIFGDGHYTELINLADTLTSASIELEKSDMIQKDLVANVSHDLKTPLTMIKSYAEMIRDISGENPEKRDEHLRVIVNETDRLNKLVNDLLTVSRIQSGKLVLEKSYFDLSETVQNIADFYKVMEDEGYHINVDCTGSNFVFADEEKIKQVVSNFVSNGIKFCGEDRTINISLSRYGRFVTCSVEDNGQGIPAEDLEHVWDRYYRSSSNTVRSKEGTGLGLSICKEILTLHKAQFGVDSRVGAGTRFWFNLEIKSRPGQYKLKPGQFRKQHTKGTTK